MRPVIGIDLGTLRTSAALVVDGGATLIADERGELFTPSCIAAAKHGKQLVGIPAKHQASLNPRNTVTGVRRLLGLPWGDPRTNTLRQRLPYALQPGARNDPRIWLRNRSYSPVEVCDLLLARVKAAAEEYLGEPVEQAAIAIPAHFESARREVCGELGASVGFELVGLIADPVAAALARGVGSEAAPVFLSQLEPQISADSQLLVVYDLGGTFECTVLENNRGALRVVGCAADPLIGGEVVDEQLVDWLCAAVAEEHKVDLRGEPLALQRLGNALEEAKHTLCSAPKATINLPMIVPAAEGEPLDLFRVLEQTELDRLCRGLVERTIAVCRDALTSASLTPGMIDDVLVLGGQAGLPRVSQQLTALFGRVPKRVEEGAVARGAALWGAQVTAGGDNVIISCPPTLEESLDEPPQEPRRPPTGERRQHPRQPVVLKVDYPSKEDFLTDFTLNISNGGMSLCTDQQLELDEHLALQISFPGLLAPLDVDAEVRWVANLESGEFEVGVELTNPSQQKRFGQLVSRVQAADPKVIARTGARVLVLEEEGRIGRLVEQAFAGRLPSGGRACEVVSVSDGHGALRLLVTQEFDVVVIDVSMPLLAGEATIRAIRAKRTRGELALVAIGEGAESHRELALEAGADFFLARPVRLSSLIETLTRLLERA